jgi:hypothetical protein
MDIIVVSIISVLVAFFAGKKYGANVEQELVARTLVEYKRAGLAGANFISSILGSLKSDYSKAFDEIEADVKKAL